MISFAKKNFSTLSTQSAKYQALVQELTSSVQFDTQNRITNLPEKPTLNFEYDHAPKRFHTLNGKEKDLAVKNHLKYFHTDIHPKLAEIFKTELNEYGHIYAFNYMPKSYITAVPYNLIPGQSIEARSMIHMILNNLDPAVAQFPQELITYGSNGAVFSNWAQFQLTLKFLRDMNENQCLHMVSGHPQGLFPKMTQHSPSAVITNGQMIPHYSTLEHYNNLYALGVTMYGQMTAGSWMYIGPQGIIHGTAITVAQAAKLQNPTNPTLKGKIFVTAGLGGMSGAQPKATTIGGGICIVAEVNHKALEKRKDQGFLNEVYTDLGKLIARAKEAQSNKETVSIGYSGNTVDLWEGLANSSLKVDIGSDQTSLHNPLQGGYYPVGISVEEANEMMVKDPQNFKERVEESLRRQVAAINSVQKRTGMLWFDYGNAFLFEAHKAGADIVDSDGNYKYKSYVQSILGPEYFDYGFGPYRWVCTSGDQKDLDLTDQIAAEVLAKQLKNAEKDIQVQIESNLIWIKSAKQNKMTVGSQARILYSDTEGRIELAVQMNKAIKDGRIKYPIVLGRDHHDVSGTDAPLRETSNIYDGSNLTADMAVQNVIGDAMRGASWVSLHNGGGTGWGMAQNGGFGLVLDGSEAAEKRARSMLFWDVTNGLTRRARALNPNAITTITRLQNKFKTEGYFPFIPTQ